MKITELSPRDMERLEFEARDRDGPYEPFQIPPTEKQLFNLKLNNFIIGPNMEVLRGAMGGVLRECHNGIPCTYWCTGRAEKRCIDHPWPDCNVPDGACLMTGTPCTKNCDSVNKREGFGIMANFLPMTDELAAQTPVKLVSDGPVNQFVNDMGHHGKEPLWTYKVELFGAEMEFHVTKDLHDKLAQLRPGAEFILTKRKIKETVMVPKEVTKTVFDVALYVGGE